MFAHRLSKEYLQSADEGGYAGSTAYWISSVASLGEVGATIDRISFPNQKGRSVLPFAALGDGAGILHLHC